MTPPGIEEVVRDLTGEEAAFVDGQRQRWHSAHLEARSPNQLLFAIAVAIGTTAVGVVQNIVPVVLVGAWMSVITIATWALSRRNARALAEARRGPWDAPDGGWRVRETRIRATAVVGAVSGDEDYVLWLLFEAPGSDWYFLDPGTLPVPDAPVACSEITIVALEPEGRPIAVRATGDALPRRGASGVGDGYAAAVDAGQIWNPDGGVGRGRVAASTLPAWMRG